MPVITPELRRVCPTPAVLVSGALKSLLLRIHADVVVETMNSERAWTNIVHPQQYMSAVSDVAFFYLTDIYSDSRTVSLSGRSQAQVRRSSDALLNPADEQQL